MVHGRVFLMLIVYIKTSFILGSLLPSKKYKKFEIWYVQTNRLLYYFTKKILMLTEDMYEAEGTNLLVFIQNKLKKIPEERWTIKQNSYFYLDWHKMFLWKKLELVQYGMQQ